MRKNNKAENYEKLPLNFNKNCLPDLQLWFLSALCGFPVDLACFHRVIVPTVTLSI